MENINDDIAIENRLFMMFKGINLYDKKVLDVGFGLGYNAAEMRFLGAEVYGVEPDEEAYAYAISNGLIDADKAMNCTLQEIPEEFLGTFDIVTIFLYNIPRSETQEVLVMISKALKNDGICIVGLHDDFYINGDKCSPPIINYFKEEFNNIASFNKFKNIGNRYYIVASSPKLNYEINKEHRTIK